MSLDIIYERRQLKGGTVVPTVPASSSHRDGTWIASDIYERELYLDISTKKLYTRAGADIVKIISEASSIGDLTDVDTTTTPPASGDVLQWDGSNWVAVTLSSSSGKIGISNASGFYTYYDTIALANAAASSGDTVEFFADVTETGATEWILKDGVNYNLNGHTYTLNNAGTSDAVTDNNIAATCTIFNGTIKRTGGSASLAAYLTIGLSAASKLTLKGVKVINDAAVSLRSSNASAVIDGGSFESPYYCCAIYSGKFINGYAYSSANRAIFCSTNSNIFNCVGVSDGSYGIEANGTANVYNSVGYSSASTGIQTGSHTGEIVNCTGISDGGVGFYATSGTSTVIGCKGVSTASYGIRCAGDFSDCTGFSTANSGGYADSNAYNCAFESTAADACGIGTGGLFNCSCVCSWNSTAGDAVSVTGTSYVFNCTLKVTNAAAYCINGTTSTVYYGSNVYDGATTPVNAVTITQGQTNAPDAYGNIQIG